MTTHYAVCSPSGLVLRVYEVPDIPQVSDGETIEELDSWTSFPSLDHLQGRVVSRAVVWEDSRTFEDIKSLKWAEIKQARAAADYRPITVGSRTFDANQESQLKIAGAVQLALLVGSAWEVDWTLTDNSVVTLTQPEVLELGLTLGARTGSIYSIARGLRASIAAAVSPEEVAGIIWPA